MTDEIRLPQAPRPRTLVHPGPVDPVRIVHRHAARGRHFRLALEPGRSLHDAIVGPLGALGVGSASMTILGGGLASLSYCVAPPDPSGARVANYTRPIAAGPALFVFGNATLGKGARGEPLVHCHATFALGDGTVRGGHVVVDRSVVGPVPLAVLVTTLDGFDLRVSFDAETAMPLMRPVAAGAEVAHA